jgi:putative FmdB family regulatory protein
MFRETNSPSKSLAKIRVKRYNNGRKKREENEMPFLQYKCKNCGKRFDELVKVYTDKVVCPDCGGETERDYAGTMYSSTGKSSQKCSGNCKTCGGCR